MEGRLRAAPPWSPNVAGKGPVAHSPNSASGPLSLTSQKFAKDITLGSDGHSQQLAARPSHWSDDCDPAIWNGR
jgi:hypothetical protein